MRVKTQVIFVVGLLALMATSVLGQIDYQKNAKRKTNSKREIFTGPGFDIELFDDKSVSASVENNFDRSISSKNMMTLSVIDKKTSTAVVDIHQVTPNKTAVVGSTDCHYFNGKKCEIELSFEDPLDNEIVRLHADILYFHLTVKKPGKIKIRYSNSETKEKRIFTALECLHCGTDQANPPLMLKEDVRKKIEKLENVERMLGSLMVLSERSKDYSEEFMDKATSMEEKMYIFAGIEVVVLILFAVWQFYYVKRLILKRRFAI